MDKKHILIIEDEVKLARFIELELKYEGYDVDMAHDGRKGLDMFYQNNYSLILLDLMLPGLNGLEICKKIRQNSDIPIIMLTAKDDIIDKVTGLDSGADDYVTKPFAIEELLARMRVALKHNRNLTHKNILQLNNLSIDTDLRVVKADNDVIDLTKTEYDLLLYLMQNKNIVLTREQILNTVWGYEYIGETNVVDVYIRYLRSKLDEIYHRKYIHTVRGVGYIVKDENLK